MDRKLINPLIVTGIADAVRAKGKTTEPIKVADLPNAIMNLPEGGGVGEDTSALLDAIGVDSREDTGMANGLAQALTDTPTEQMWSGERSVADGAPIKDGVAFVSALKGKTMKVNQMIETRVVNTTSSGVSFTSNGDGYYLVNGTATANALYRPITYGAPIFNTSHKYLLCGAIDGVSQKYILQEGNTGAIDSGKGVVFTPRTAEANVAIKIFSGQTATNVRFCPMLKDLTDEYGSGNEPTTPNQYANDHGYAKIEDMPYIPYQETNLQSFAPNAIVSKGRNLWDGNGVTPKKYLSDNGSLNSSSTSSVSDYVGIRPNVDYCLIGVGGSNPALCWYDEDKAFISGVRYSGRTMVVETAPSNARYIRFSFLSASEEVCLSASGTTDGTYTPYIAPSHLDFNLTTIVDADGNQLFPEGELRSAGSVADMVDYANNVAVKGKKVIGRVDLSSMTYRYSDSAGCWYATYQASLLAKMKLRDGVYLDSYNSVYPLTKIIGVNGDILRLYTNDSVNLPSGELYYELAEPIDGEAPLVKSFYPVQNNGTEEAITDSIVPMNADIRYRVDTESLLTQSASLLRYSNEVTGANDSSLGNAVKTLTDNYK